ncbi:MULTISPECIES: hypothetical protein [Bartonella]|uniref:Uncharacterized protein n=1 Tax=Bartonella rochalimae ATCC BAA-1498 TaxID=685782 RepID=E6YNG4_9HYPH|nr:MULTISPECIES: hypothetical protein [Bartonella]AQX18928.1 hypothetical protein BA1379B_011270 [Bartonella sp. A1379B]AQX25920.1 hypothetical protein Bco22_012760 [Bartonella sp. Coyote22sub2]AQX27208.1 hypothetical protein Bra60_012380 [Bartonella sp. Raccoon60]KEC54951.1 hypothetical protein O99_00849 [Bartonella rochalimae ATCC BAA-1498]CBI78402.1 conserved hypothetical protein [Bartonella rochalimae ATCC BAA-1498]
MYIFQSPCSKNDKIKKRIAQLKEELTTINRQSLQNNRFDSISKMLKKWKQKGHHALYHINNHAEELKKKAKDNPKTTLLLTAGLVLTSYCLMRKN